jgi:hypothetical protein
MQLVKNALRRSRLYPRLYSLRYLSCLSSAARKEIRVWKRAGRPLPPPGTLKRRTIRSYASKHGLKVLVETGTFLGETVATLRCKFDRIYSIELSETFYLQAVERFKDAANVHLICGDSGVELGNVLAGLDQPALFWLDGHWCGGTTARGEKNTPILDELTLVLARADKPHVILIDDARQYGKYPGYPSIEELRAFVAARRPELEFSVDDDIIRITPGARPTAS